MDIPASLIDGLNASEVEVVRAWWSKLPESNQSELRSLCDRLRESSFFDASDGSEGLSVPRVVGGRFAPTEDTRGWVEWRSELFDYLVCHPEFAEPQVIRIFHIGCSRHLRSMGMAETMMDHVELRCPLDSKTCPIQSFAHRRVSC